VTKERRRAIALLLATHFSDKRAISKSSSLANHNNGYRLLLHNLALSEFNSSKNEIVHF
jgi:hypothetical protein